MLTAGYFKLVNRVAVTNAYDPACEQLCQLSGGAQDTPACWRNNL